MPRKYLEIIAGAMYVTRPTTRATLEAKDQWNYSVRIMINHLSENPKFDHEAFLALCGGFVSREMI